MPAGMGEEERFAAAVENGTTPASLGYGDWNADDLGRELEIVGLLRSGAPALGPEPGARERARQRLMDAFAGEFGGEFGHAELGHGGGDASEATAPIHVVAPVALATRPEVRAEATLLEDAAAPDDRPQRRSGRHSAPGADDESEATVHQLRTRPEPAQRGGHRRAAVLGAAAAAALVALAGGGTFASQGALPGDSMYGVKRVAESTSYALTFGQDAKARRHLEQAQHRLDEVEGMVARDKTVSTSAPAAATSNPDLVRSTMQEFDADASEGSRQLLDGSDPDTAQVDEVRTWATEQSSRLSQIRSTLPAPDRADQSLALLDKVLDETAALQDPSCRPAADADADNASASADPNCAPSDARTTVQGDQDTESATTPEDDPDADTTGRSTQTGSGDRQNGTDRTRSGSGTSAGSSTGSTDEDDDTTDRQQSDSDSDSDDGDSGASDGAGNLSVPLPAPVPPVKVPSVLPGVPGLHLGGGGR
jgi:Domain of unknown function (DUF5667)